jgi:hypothetical protein
MAERGADLGREALMKPTKQDCGRCHTCGHVLRELEYEEDQYCDYCKKWRYYASHGWTGETFTDTSPCKQNSNPK